MNSAPKPLPGSSPDEMFPALAAEQQARLLTHGRIRKVASGEKLVELKQQPTTVFVVIAAKLEAVRLTDVPEGRAGGDPAYKLCRAGC